jgi:predicted nucleic acid-binding protein
VTTDYILVECWFLIGSRLGRRAAMEFWDGLRSGIIEIIKVESQDLEGARRIIERFLDQEGADISVVLVLMDIEAVFGLVAVLMFARF